MEELLKAGDYDGLAQHCEQEELKVSRWAEGISHNDRRLTVWVLMFPALHLVIPSSLPHIPI